VLPFAVFKGEDPELTLFLKMLKLKLEVESEVCGKFVVVSTKTL
jgi:hypothetical protein